MYVNAEPCLFAFPVWLTLFGEIQPGGSAVSCLYRLSLVKLTFTDYISKLLFTDDRIQSELETNFVLWFLHLSQWM